MDEFEHINRIYSVADDFTAKHTGRKYSDLSEDEKRLLAEYMQLSTMRVEVSANAARAMFAVNRLCHQLVKIVGENEKVLGGMPPESIILGITLMQYSEELDAALASMQRQGKLLLVESCQALKDGTLEAKVKRLKEAVPPLGTSSTTNEEASDD